MADTGGLLRALARRTDGRPTWPDYEAALTAASRVVVPALVLAEVDYFLSDERLAMRRLVGEMLDPATTYELEPVLPADLVRAMQLDAAFPKVKLGLVDAMVATVCERRGIPDVLTTDRRDFATVRIGPRLSKSLNMLP